MQALHLPATGHATLPWKNGLGVSRIIASDPPGAGYDALRWQVGATEIGADCPFSELKGLDRQFMVIAGEGVELASIDESAQERACVVKPMHIYAFRGDWKTGCRLIRGPVTVLNAIARRGACSVSMRIASGGSVDGVPGESLVIVELKNLDAWRLDGAGSLQLPPGPAAVVRIGPA